MDDSEVDDFLHRFAPPDVQDTVAWLTANGYVLTSHSGEGVFGSQFVYLGNGKVVITVDRSQWMLDVAPRPDADAWQYDLLIAAQAGQPYETVVPNTSHQPVGHPLPEQLPEGVSWRESLPDTLRWVAGDGAQGDVDRARHERHRMMWRSP